MITYTKDRFSDKVMIVTGGASGIGKEVAIRAAKEGAKVVIVDLNEEKGNEVVKEITEFGGECSFQRVNLTEEDEVKIMVQTAVEQYGKLDILINNAGITSKPQVFHLTSQETLEKVIQCNFYSLFYCSKYFINQLLKQKSGGSIVNTASISGINGIPNMAPYVTSKHAINGITKNMAIDYAKYGIRVNSVNPYATTTPLGEEGLNYVKEAVKKAKEAGIDLSKLVMPGRKNNNLQQRNASAAEQASSILYLASDEASHITGAIFQTDGGYSTY